MFETILNNKKSLLFAGLLLFLFLIVSAGSVAAADTNSDSVGDYNAKACINKLDDNDIYTCTMEVSTTTAYNKHIGSRDYSDIL